MRSPTRHTAWLSVAILLSSAATASAQLTVGPPASTGVIAGRTVTIPIMLTNPSGTPVDAFGFAMDYPAELMTFQSISSAGTITDGWFVVSGSENSPGMVQVGGFNDTPVTTGGVLLNAVFDVKVDALGSGPLALSALVDDLAPATAAAGTVTASAGPGATGLIGEYYDNIDFTGTLLQRIDPAVDFDWANGSPDPSMGVDDYSIRWTGWLRPDVSETYTFYTQTDDGVRLWIDDQLVIDKWIDQAVTEWSGTIALQAGVEVSVRMEFYERGGQAVARLFYSAPGVVKQVIPADHLLAAPCVAGGGDVDGDGILTPTDVACAFDVYLSGQTAGPGCDYPAYACEVASADVDCTGQVTPEDARAIELRRAAALPPAACFATASPPPPPTAAPYQIALVQSVVDDGGTPRLRVSIALQDAAGLDAFGARLLFPPALVSFRRADTGFGNRGWANIGGRESGAGEALIGGFDAYAPLGPGPQVVCDVYFDFLATPGAVGGLALSDLVDDFTGATVVSSVTGVGETTPTLSRLHPNHPNPFNPSTTIAYEIAGGEAATVPVRVAVYDVTGRCVRVLVDANVHTGFYATTWDGRSDAGTPVASGVYICSMRAGSVHASRRMVLLK